MARAGVDTDEQLARALQRQEFHRSNYPSYLVPLGPRQAPHMPPQRRPPVPAEGAYHDPRNVIRENRALALEVNPEAFVPVSMLYVECKLNNIPVKAFVDTGAQMTVISKGCAELCGLSHLIDTNFEGIAAGVGVARIVGRIHLAELQLGGVARAGVSLTVIDQKQGPSLLLGLDMMRKYRAAVDLERNCMRIGGETLPFVAGDEPRHHR